MKINLMKITSELFIIALSIIRVIKLMINIELDDVRVYQEVSISRTRMSSEHQAKKKTEIQWYLSSVVISMYTL